MMQLGLNYMNINKNGSDGFRIDIEIYSHRSIEHKDDEWYTWKQARYLVHGIDDSMWTNDINEALSYLKEELKRLQDIAPDD